jgi:cytochrome P450
VTLDPLLLSRIQFAWVMPAAMLIFAMRGAGLFLVEESEWERHRKLLAPTFRHPASTFWLRISSP